jgi:hypothetical protein
MKRRVIVLVVSVFIVSLAAMTTMAFMGNHTDDPFTYPTPGVTCIGPPPGLIGDGVCHN